jgi:hypothetical protein
LPHHHPVLEGKMSCADCHEPHKGIAIKGAPTNIQQKLKAGGLAFLSKNETCFESKWVTSVIVYYYHYL